MEGARMPGLPLEESWLTRSPLWTLREGEINLDVKPLSFEILLLQHLALANPG